ncbi:aminoglycoside phosphotransferase APH(3') [Mycobacterium asiaticum]|uniref:Aminoglycoside phosphotransferase APH(3') n=1 Tax=Mycobacterium asiaticum TaxID=1790 RepID=A0A1A3P5W0_MYCAS|nr:phosphotransferase [Mycobacterium asiaticum]OBK29556.1 aminoglycoside phosphotransferase APH(3') [Mycobacterium asiaticum]
MAYPSGPKSAAVPAVVRRLAAGRPVHAVWRNELGDLTFRIAHGAEFVKVTTRESADFANEARRLRWAGRYIAVPPVLSFGVDGARRPYSAWLHTRGLSGLSAVHPRWQAAPGTAVRAIAVGLRTMHDALPVATCPFDWSVASRLPLLLPAHRANLPDQPPIEKLVVCHGDACAPNTLISDVGTYCGHVDFGELGIADRWADLAVATLSLGWNYPGHNWETEFFTAYGIEPDPVRIDYYRRLWQDPDL